MTEKYCPIPISTCEYTTNTKADCENCDLNKRYSTRTIDNWETFIIDRKTEKEYGYDVDKLISLLNELNDENEQLKQQKQQYKGQRDYLLFVIERRCSKELFEETKSYLKGDVE